VKRLAELRLSMLSSKLHEKPPPEVDLWLSTTRPINTQISISSACLTFTSSARHITHARGAQHSRTTLLAQIIAARTHVSLSQACETISLQVAVAHA